MLERSFYIEKVEESVLEDRPSHAPTVLGALKRFRESRWRRQGSSQRAVTEEFESFAMNSIGPRTRGHIDRARGGQFGGKVQARLAELELLDRARRNVRC